MSILEKVIAAVIPSTTEGEVNAIDLLKKDHDDVDALFRDYEMLAEGDGDGGDRRALSTRICGMLAVHAMIEEEIFYPAARNAGVDADLLDEAEIEHGAAKELIAQIGAADPSQPLYDARVKVLGEYIRHHVKEEESELFPACHKCDMDMAEIGARLQERKTQLLRKLAGKGKERTVNAKPGSFPTESRHGLTHDRERSTSEERDMPGQSTRGRAQDRAKVAGGQEHETSYEAKKTGTSSIEVRSAVKKVGNSRGKVEAELKK
jgi:hemerythrin superfamily protein